MLPKPEKSMAVMDDELKMLMSPLTVWTWPKSRLPMASPVISMVPSKVGQEARSEMAEAAEMVVESEHFWEEESAAATRPATPKTRDLNNMMKKERRVGRKWWIWRR